MSAVVVIYTLILRVKEKNNTTTGRKFTTSGVVPFEKEKTYKSSATNFSWCFKSMKKALIKLCRCVGWSRP